MSPDKVLKHIDQTVIEKIKEGKRWNDIIYYLSENIERYKKRDAYIQVSEYYLVKNWDKIDWKKRMTTCLVIYSSRRVNDIKWIKNKHRNFPQFGNVKMYKMISLRDKLKTNII